MLLRSLAHFHSDTLHGRLHDVCLLLVHEVSATTGRHHLMSILM